MPAYPFFEDYVLTDDGVSILTRVIVPLNYVPGAKMPCVLHRTPYESAGDEVLFDPSTLGRPFGDFLDRGYIVVNQHCRGTGGSTGVFRNMQNEREDSLSTLEWIRKRTWYNGEIYLYGNSYKSFVHSTILGLNPPDVKGAVLAVMPANQQQGCYEKRTFKHDLITFWFTKTFMKKQVNVSEINRRMYAELPKRPLETIDKRVYGFEIPQLIDMYKSEFPEDSFWTDPATGNGQAAEAPEKTHIPLLLVGGEYDIHYNGTLQYFLSIPEEHRKNCALFMGPWTHSLKTLPEHAKFFPASGHPPVEAEWFDHLRLGYPLNYVTKGLVTYYRPGEGWRRAETIGEGSVPSLTLYPDAEGHLLETPSEGSRSYIYDPEDPLNLPGGPSVFQTAARGPQIQPEPDSRQDLLSFISAPFQKKIMLDGEIEAELEISSDCPDTAFFVRFDVIRKGEAWCIRDTIMSVSHCIDDYVPGTRRKIRLVIDPVTWCLQPGDCIRMDVSSSDYPCYQTHSNTAEPWYSAVETRIAHNTVYTEGSKFVFSVSE